MKAPKNPATILVVVFSVLVFWQFGSLVKDLTGGITERIERSTTIK